YKLFVLADSSSGYTYNLSMYEEKAWKPSGIGLSFVLVKSVQRWINQSGTWSTQWIPVPEPVWAYNKFMRGVDLSDALIKYLLLCNAEDQAL
ncbi:hypothetical protein P4O66_022221, partial [Electrophorus voltai]